MTNFIRILLIFMPAFLFAESSKQKGAVFLESGAYVTQVTERLAAPAGTLNEVSTLAGFLRLRTSSHLGKNWFFEPALGTMVPWRSGVDGSTKTFMTHLNLDVAKAFGSFLKLRFGPGIFWQWMVSNEEAIILGNGEGNSTFYTPNGNSSVFLASVEAGLSLHLAGAFFLNADIYALQLFNKDRRRLNGTLTLGMRL
jgi:hypothetical protein